MPSAFRYAPLAPVRTIRLCLAGRLHVDETAAFLAGGEHNHAIHEGVNRVVLAHTYVKTGMVNRATLTLDDIACFGVLTAKNLHSESFAFRLTAVLRTTDTFFMCHFFLEFILGVKQLRP